MSLLSLEHLQNEEAAYAWVEAHIWPEGPVCPHCKGIERISKMKGTATRIGLYKCYACRKQFNVKVGTIFEKSHVLMHVWLQAFYLIAGSKKGISSNQLHRTLGVTLKTAWFMGHRILEAMRTGSLLPPMGRPSAIIEADETYIGKTKNYVCRANQAGGTHKQKVLSHCDERHLHRYLAEFDFRYNNRVARGVHDEPRARENGAGCGRQAPNLSNG
jgi:transposase-like protein